MRFLFYVIVISFLLTSSVGTAQETTEESSLKADDLPISIERIKRQLERLQADDNERSILRLDYYIEVYGRAPRINVIQNFDIYNGPVRYGTPLHTELRSITTPPELRTPSVISLPIARWNWNNK